MAKFGGRDTSRWDAKFPDIAVGDGSQVDRATGEADLSTETTFGSTWIDAPGDSHLLAFAMEDFRDLKGNTRASIALERKSRILVRFKPTPKNPVVAEYEYLFTDHGLAKSYFESMVGHSDPGEVVWQMIRAGVPYRAIRR